MIIGLGWLVVFQVAVGLLLPILVCVGAFSNHFHVVNCFDSCRQRHLVRLCLEQAVAPCFRLCGSTCARSAVDTFRPREAGTLTKRPGPGSLLRDVAGYEPMETWRRAESQQSPTTNSQNAATVHTAATDRSGGHLLAELSLPLRR